MDNPKVGDTGNTQGSNAQETGSIFLIWGLLAGVGTACVFGLGGFLLLRDPTYSMGIVLFLLLPFATGVATGLIARRWNLVIAALIIALAVCSAVLLLTGQEGWVCVLMSLPLIIVGLSIGGLLGVLIRIQIIDKSRRPRVMGALLLLVLPLFLMGANSVEEPWRQTPRAETFTSVLVVDAPPEKVWDTIKIMDHVTARRGFLMRIGLPVPISCSIDKEGVGGKRTCYFVAGYIEERITEWDPPRSMKLEITAWDVPGRPWLDFKDASYEFHQENDRTIMTRTTTIASRLLPAWYWRRFEKIGVETEHQYLFEAVKNKMDGGK